MCIVFELKTEEKIPITRRDRVRNLTVTDHLQIKPIEKLLGERHKLCYKVRPRIRSIRQEQSRRSTDEMGGTSQGVYRKSTYLVGSNASISKDRNLCRKKMKEK